MNTDRTFTDVILVTDKVLAASLFALSHRALYVFEQGDNDFNCAFKITKRLRADLKDYIRPGLTVNVRSISDELDELDSELYMRQFQIAQSLHSKNPELFHQDDIS